MDKQYIIWGVILVLLLLFFLRTKFKHQEIKPPVNTKRPSETLFPSREVSNDKIVIIENANDKDVKKILRDLCNLYNEKEYAVIPRLTKLLNNRFAVTFPYDINFETFCYFINYVSYPMGFDKRFQTIGWTTTTSTDMWITDKSANKNVMLFVSDYDTEYDNVFLTTSDNIGYKLGFALGEEEQLLEKPEKLYQNPPLQSNELATKEFIDYK